MASITNTTHRKVSVPSNLERRAFLYMRLSGLALLFLAVGHMMIQHVFNSSQNLYIEFVAQQWSSWVWKAYDILLLIFAISHGFNGLRNVLEDYIHNRNVIKWINRILALVIIVTIIWAAFNIAIFDSASVR